MICKLDIKYPNLFKNIDQILLDLKRNNLNLAYLKIKGTVMQIKKSLINDRLRISKVS